MALSSKRDLVNLSRPARIHDHHVSSPIPVLIQDRGPDRLKSPHPGAVLLMDVPKLLVNSEMATGAITAGVHS